MDYNPFTDPVGMPEVSDKVVTYLVRHAVTRDYLYGTPDENLVIAWREHINSKNEGHLYAILSSPPAKRGQQVVATWSVVDDLAVNEPVPGDILPIILVEVESDT